MYNYRAPHPILHIHVASRAECHHNVNELKTYFRLIHDVMMLTGDTMHRCFCC